MAIDKPYNIRPKNGTRFPVSIGADIIKETPIEHKYELALTLSIRPDGQLILDYTMPEVAPDHAPRVSVKVSSSGVVRVPSSIGQALSIGAAAVNWELHEHVGHDEMYTIRGVTDHYVDAVEPDAGEPLDFAPLDWQSQTEIDGETLSSPQEQFRRYFPEAEMQSLGWQSDNPIALSIRRRDTRPALVVEPAAHSAEGLIKSLGSTTPDYDDGLLYVPTDIARALGLVETPMMWVEDGSRVIGAAANR